MRRILRFNEGVIDWQYMDAVLKIFPELESKFTQRKNYSEYYYSESIVLLTSDDIDQLTKDFLRVVISSGYIDLIML